MPSAATKRELERQALGSPAVAAGLVGGQHHAGQRRDDRRPTAARPGARRRARPTSTGTIALVATIGATMLIVPTASAR